MKNLVNSFVLLLVFTSVTLSQSTFNINSGFIDVPNGQLYFEIAGNGDETIVFIHDGLIHHEIWDNQFEVFAKDYNVVRYDRRGYGKSPMPKDKYSNVKDLDNVFNYLKIEKAILVGMSAGGGLAIDFTLANPEKVSALLLVGAVVSGFGYSEHMMTRGGRLTAEDFGNPDKLLEYFLKEDPYEIAPQNTVVKEKLWKLMQPYPLDFTKNQLEEKPKRPAKDFLNEIDVSTLIIVGEFDIPDVFVHAGVIESGIQLSQKVIIRNAGHLVPIEQPEMFNEQVQNFINGAEFFKILHKKGVSSAVEMFKEKRKKDNDWVPFTENRINVLGYLSLQSGKVKDAIELFKMNVLAYPESSNVYDSLAEAYMINGDKKLAVQNYKKSLELNPANSNAVNNLKKLEILKKESN